MTLTRVGMAARMVVSGLRRPGDVPRYLRHSVFHRAGLRAGLMDLELPWFSYGAISFLKGWLRPDMTVYEYGSGGSTLFFAKLVATVVSIEHDPGWCARLRTELSGRGYDHVALRLASFDCPSQDRFAESEFALALPNDPADAVVIDSADYTTWRSWARRVQLFPVAASRVRPGGVVVVDDSWRYPQLRARHPLVRVFFGMGPGRRGLTSTDVYSF